ncbi:protein root primordium defective 1 [Phtheirospermum japonicum]|uniref:Protein root primordium defective 1 n=1 Tax=Phtheirospermum japonicum TaxID=374723 RepID=A0A830B192_9LAMI|nr:protein root primordium defective 1 [Phtheirospermum japonicum]
MNFLHHSSSHIRRRHHLQVRTLYDAVTTLKCPRDRGFDHAVERERHLKPLLNLKNLILSEPSKSIPLALITQSNETLGIPFRPIEFIRKYPSIFQEFHPGDLNIQPHIKLTPEILSLHTEENLLYQSVSYKQDIARRLLKLLMIGKINKIPIFVLDRLSWELGLPRNYAKLIIPEFPDYFRVISENKFGENGKILELVCWTDEFAVSEMEKKGDKDGKTQFLLQYSKEFEMDKKYKKWVDEWQKLPYISPYENATHLAAKTDESDKWAVAVLHELLNLFVGKKAERDSLLYLGEHLGLRSRFKLAFLQHPGIFYVSSKIGTHTVVLKEGYKRGMLIERHSLNDMRFKYVQLMNVETDEEKPKSTKKKTGKKGSEGKESENGEEEDDAGKESEDDEEEDDDEMYDSSDDEEEDESEDDDEGFEGENGGKRGGLKRRGENFEESDSRRNVGRRTNGRTDGKKYYGRFEGENGGKRGGYTRKGENFQVSDSRRNVGGRGNGRTYEKNSYGEGENGSKRGGFNRRGESFEENDSRRNVGRRTNGRTYEKKNYGLRFEGENVTSRGRFRGKGESFEENNSRRNVDRNNGRTYEKNNYGKGFEGENGSKRGGFKSRGADYGENNSRRNVPGRANGRAYEKTNYGKGFEGENGSKRGGFKSRRADYEENNTRRNGTRRTSGRNSEENEYKSSTRFSKRPNVRNGDPNVPRLRTQKSDFSGNKAGI